MRALLLSLLWTLISIVQTFTCTTAPAHAHDAIREGQVSISSWVDCTMVGTVNGSAVRLWADSSRCALHAKAPGVFQIRYDATCGQVLDLSNGALPPYCPPTPTPSPTPSDEVKDKRVVDPQGAVWTIGSNLETLRNGVHVADGRGSIYKLTGGVVYVLGTDKLWYRWGGWWVPHGLVEPGGGPTPTPSPTPEPSPTPSPSPSPSPTPSPSPSPTPSPATVDVVFRTWPSNELARQKLITEMATRGYKFCGTFNSSACFWK